MKLRYYQLNAFTGNGFKGNPAGVCLVDEPIDEKLLQEIAKENNLSETAFIVKNKTDFSIRWFTPDIEVDLCGHATLASGFILMNLVYPDLHMVSFQSRSGVLSVRKKDVTLVMDFPSDEIEETEIISIFKKALHAEPFQAFKGKTDYMLVFRNESEIRQMIPDFDLLKTIHARGIIVTAPGDRVDFVSRFFAPQSGIPEDPVTGSAHTTLTPFWARKLNKKSMLAWQLSKRGGEIHCVYLGDRTEIEGQARLYISGFIHI
jgi:PhzF family phenazine biosynthesis protein